MRKILLLLSLLAITTIISCSEDSGSDSDKGYVNLNLDNEKTVALKSYDVGGFSCSGKQCGAVIYRGELSDTKYVGFAAGKDTAYPDFALKIYWNGSSIPASLDTTTFSVSINDGTYTYTNTSDNLNITIVDGTDANSVPIYTITFQESITVDDGSGHNFTISATNSLVAYKY
ncbi:MAG TPA: hypothetical protein PK358_03180 [Spirochaetota bacterium]|nr:hypothetical protein [Spirochaetota bacterium]